MLEKIVSNKFTLLIILIVLFFAFSYIEGNTIFGNKSNEENIEEIKNTKKEELDEKVSEEIIEDEESSVIIQDKESIVASTPTNIPQPSSSMDSFVYSGGNVIEKDSAILRMNSSNNPTEITDWYKEKIKEFDMNATSVVSTNTNGNVLNKIAASNGNLKIEIEISRSNSEEKASIVVKLL